MTWTLYEGACLEILPTLPDKCIDMILCDLPYGTTACKWDAVIPFEPLWEQYERLIKDNGAIVLTASQPFTSLLVTSNLKLFRYSWVWDKKIISNPQLAKIMPLKQHEDVCVFYKKHTTYNPIKTNLEKKRTWKQYSPNNMTPNGTIRVGNKGVVEGLYPKSIICFTNANQRGKIHPTQKPVALFEYLIRTYTNPGDTILDNCAGSGTTGEAAERTGRNSILIEKEPKYCEIIRKRLTGLQIQQALL